MALVKHEALIRQALSQIFHEVLSEQEWAEILQMVEVREIKAGETFLKEGTRESKLTVICQGSLSFFKREEIEGGSHVIYKLKRGEMFGESSMLKEPHHRITSCKATRDSIVAMIDGDKLRLFLRDHPKLQDLYATMLRNQYQRLSRIYKDAVKHIHDYVMETKIRRKFSLFFIFTIFTLTLYTIFLRAIEPVLPLLPGSTLVTIPVLTFIVLASFICIRMIGFKLKDYGFTLKNWKPIVLEAIAYTAIFIAFFTLIKVIYFLLWHPGGLSAIFPVEKLHANADKARLSLRVFLALQIALYMLHVPLQETVARGFLQTSLIHLMKIRYSRAWSIIISNMLFSAYHLHISILAFFGAFVAGVFWGWLYSKHYALPGVIVSHMLIGIWAILFLGVI